MAYMLFFRAFPWSRAETMHAMNVSVPVASWLAGFIMVCPGLLHEKVLSPWRFGHTSLSAAGAVSS